MLFLAFLNFAAAIQGIFITYLLAHNRYKSRESMLLGVLTMVLSISLLGAVLGLSGYYRVFPHLIRIGDPFVLLYGPLVYLYVFALINQRMPKMYLLHGLPFLLYVASVIPFYSLPAGAKIEFTNQVFLNNELPIKVILIQILRLTHISVYIVLGYLMVKTYQRKIKENFSNIEKISLDRAARVLQFFFIVTLVSIGIYLSGGYYSMNFVLTNNIIGLFIGLIIYMLAFSTWNKQALKETAPILENNPSLDRHSVSDGANGKMKERSNYFLTDDQVRNYSQMLEKLLKQDKLYLDNNLTLSLLSERMKLQPYLASELINRFAGVSFFDFINQHRVEEVKQRLTDPMHSSLSILGIAYDCGFNTKSSFNAAFKKFTNLTPSEFRHKNTA